MQSRGNWFNVSEGIALAAMPAIIYLWCYSYTWAYDTQLGIPSEFVSVDVAALLHFGLFAMVFLAFILTILRFAFVADELATKEKGFHWLSSMVIKHSLLAIVVVSFAFIVGTLLLLALIPILIGLDLLRDKASKQRGDEHLQSLGKLIATVPGEIFWIDRTKLGTLLKAAGFVATGMFIASSAGNRQAVKQSEFFVLSSNPDALVVGIVDGNAVCTVYDAKTKQLQNKVLIVKLGEDNAKALESKKIGPLHFQDTEVSYLER